MYRTWNGVLPGRKLWDITDIYIYTKQQNV